NLVKYISEWTINNKMGRELDQYIKDRLKKGVDENTLRYNLQAAGWSNEQINSSLEKAKKTDNKIIISLSVLFIVLVLGGGFFLIVNNFQEMATPVNGNSQMQSCNTIIDGDKKI